MWAEFQWIPIVIPEKTLTGKILKIKSSKIKKIALSIFSFHQLLQSEFCQTQQNSERIPKPSNFSDWNSWINFRADGLDYYVCIQKNVTTMPKTHPDDPWLGLA